MWISHICTKSFILICFYLFQRPYQKANVAVSLLRDVVTRHDCAIMLASRLLWGAVCCIQERIFHCRSTYWQTAGGVLGSRQPPTNQRSVRSNFSCCLLKWGSSCTLNLSQDHRCLCPSVTQLTTTHMHIHIQSTISTASYCLPFFNLLLHLEVSSIGQILNDLYIYIYYWFWNVLSKVPPQGYRTDFV